ncbi:hypothetical protein [Nocardiopsis baichengensis]|uniref:hypothetical protein n=1 Tax=Nocardiopsis baichengensis TaxID=280240 RepID=UPI00034D2E7C|nr:hypothetical protein [Nocardiopsis baichengensis]
MHGPGPARLTGERDDEFEGDVEMGGIYIGGSMTGGAIAGGDEAVAEDRGRRTGEAALPAPPPPTSRPVSAPAGQVVVAGHVTGGAAAAGRGSRAVDRSERTAGTERELRARLEEVRRELERRPRTFEVEAVAGELAAAESQITDSGTDRGLVRRLLDLFQGGSTVLRETEAAAQVMETLQGSLAVLDAAGGEE